MNSRIHVVEEFNKNVYDIIIAADEHEILGERGGSRAAEVEPGGNPSASNQGAARASNKGSESNIFDSTSTADQTTEKEPLNGKQNRECRKLRRKPKMKNNEYGISRGIDFKNVACVLNFDLPTTSKSYTHRIGRTARAGKTGVALSFVVPPEHYHKHKAITFPTAEHDEKVLAQIIRHQSKKGKDVKPYQFDMKQIDAFRYRMNDALRAVTRIAIREARTRELRQELLKSEKLRRHFEENPGDLYHLRHDGELRAARLQSHLKHVPDYLMPTNGKNVTAAQDIGFVGMRKTSENRIRKARMQNRVKGKGRNIGGRKADPLKTFNGRVRR